MKSRNRRKNENGCDQGSLAEKLKNGANHVDYAVLLARLNNGNALNQSKGVAGSPLFTKFATF